MARTDAKQLGQQFAEFTIARSYVNNSIVMDTSSITDNQLYRHNSVAPD
jgi:hypothetical protein